MPACDRPQDAGLGNHHRIGRLGRTRGSDRSRRRGRRLTVWRAAARAGVTGQIVDTITNIKTVKLFAHDEHEDRAALDSIERYRWKAVDWAALAVWFRFLLILLAGVLPVAMLGYGLMRWNVGAVTSGDLAAVGAMSRGSAIFWK